VFNAGPFPAVVSRLADSGIIAADDARRDR
jgi:hypothetical protein